MKVLSFLAIVLSLTILTTSCDKEGALSVIDNTPEFEVLDETTSSDNLTLGDKSMTCDAIALATYISDGETNVNNYSLSLGATSLGDAGAVFVGAWSPAEPETSLQEMTYSDQTGSIIALSEEAFDVIEAWRAAGVTYTISNITETTADVVVAGEMIDDDGNATSVSGSFTAELVD